MFDQDVRVAHLLLLQAFTAIDDGGQALRVVFLALVSGNGLLFHPPPAMFCSGLLSSLLLC